MFEIIETIFAFATFLPQVSTEFTHDVMQNINLNMICLKSTFVKNIYTFPRSLSHFCD